MDKNKKIEDIVGIIFPIVVLAMAILTIVTMLETKDWLGIGMNLIFLTIMAVLIMRAEEKGLKKLRLLSEESNDIYQRLKNIDLEIDPKTRKDSVRSLNIAFTDEFVNEKWNSYLSENSKTSIDTYLSEEELFSHYEKSYCDMVPGLLTALGILGTFLGLIFSIASFSMDNMEQLEQALGNIIGGMNVAFYTSVYGVALSILFNLISRNCQKRARENLYELCFFLHTNLEEVFYDDVNKQLVGQNADHLEEVKEIKSILKYEMADSLSQQLNGNMIPVFEEINQTLKRVIGDFRVEQSAALQHVVESFVDEMAVALDSHINDLGKSVDRLSASQEIMSNELRNLLDEIKATTKDTQKINFETTNILSKLDVYMGRINTMMSVASDTFNNVNAYALEMYRATQEQQKFIKDFSAHETKMLEGCTVANQNMETAVKANASALKQMESQMQQTRDVMEQLVGYMNESTQETMAAFKNLTDVQVAGNVQNQNLRTVMEKIVSLEQEKLEKNSVSKNSGTEEIENLSDKNLKELLVVQATALKNINEYLCQQELRRENMWWNRLMKKVKTLIKVEANGKQDKKHKK